VARGDGQVGKRVAQRRDEAALVLCVAEGEQQGDGQRFGRGCKRAHRSDHAHDLVLAERLEHPLGAGSLGDPHDVRLLPNGHLLITDAPLGLVVEAGWDGQVFRLIGGDTGPVTLDDPHSAQLLENGLVLVCDSGNDRVVWVGADGAAVTELRALRSDSAWFRFSGPRYAEVSPSGVLVVADTGNNRVLASAESGELLWELASVTGTRLPFLNQPRWAQLSAAGEVVVCDHCHHRVLRFRWEPE